MKQAKRPARGVYNQGISKNDPRIAHLSKPPTDKPTSAPTNKPTNKPTTEKQYSKGEASEGRPANRLINRPANRLITTEQEQ